MKNTINECKIFENGSILTPVCRIAWPALDKPRAVIQGSDKLRFMVTLLFDTQEVDINPLINAAHDLAVKNFGPNYAKMRGFEMPVKDGSEKGKIDEETGEFRIFDGYGPGIWYVNSKSKFAPQLIDRSKAPADPSKFYGGCYARALGNLFSYKPDKSNPASKAGIGFGFQALQFVNDGEPFGGARLDAGEAFDALD